MEYINTAVTFFLAIMLVAFIAGAFMVYFQGKDHDAFLSCMAARRTGQPLIFKMADDLAKAKLHAKHKPHSSWAVNEASWKEIQLNEYIRVNGSL